MPTRRFWTAAALLMAVSCAAAVAVLFAAATLRAHSHDLDDRIADATGGHRFSIVGYTLTHAPQRWLVEVADWFGEPADDESAILQRWFSDQPESERSESQRQAAEILLERRLERAAAELGLATPLPLFGSVQLVWPPVDLHLSAPLHVLIVSPRDEVRQVRSILLREDVPRDAYADIESAIEAGGEWSAWVGRVGGVALYPASVVDTRGFLSTLQIMAHEWAHHYLSFHPLGLSYGSNTDMRTINETVADIVGDELGQLAADYPGGGQPHDPEAASQAEEIRRTTDPILRQLRLDVDQLLEEGNIDEAEELMSEKRTQLAQLGRPYRRINQAWLAFQGTYAANPSSPSQWGTRLIQHRSNQDSLASFLKSVQEIGNPTEAHALLPH